MKTTFNIELSSDGRPSKFGNEFGLNLEEAAESLLYYDIFSNEYTEEEMTDYLEKLKPGYVMRGARWSEIKITKK